MAKGVKPHNYRCRVGETFGLWTVLDDTERRHEKVYFLCRCACGTERTVQAQSVLEGRSTCCGCKDGKPHEKHGRTRQGLSDADRGAYANWSNMIQRCHNPNARKYRFYGGRGVTVCDEWRNSFAAFLAHMGERPAHAKTIDRIDNSRGYEPGNCRWATQAEQNRNQSFAKPDMSTRRRCPQTGRLLPNHA